MRRIIPVCLLSTVAGGCDDAKQRWQETLAAPDLHTVSIESDQGLVRYAGTGPADAVEARITSWASGISEAAAERRLEANTWDLEVTEGALLGSVVAPRANTGVDFRLEGPPAVDTDIIVYKGEVRLESLDGFHVITADRVEADDLHGSVDLFAGRHGLEAEVYPDPGTYNVLQSYGGDLTLRLPEEGDYTIEVVADPEYGMLIRDLGFDEVYGTFDYLYAVKGTGETVIEAVVAGGSFFLFVADPLEDTATDDTTGETTTRR